MKELVETQWSVAMDKPQGVQGVNPVISASVPRDWLGEGEPWWPGTSGPILCRLGWPQPPLLDSWPTVQPSRSRIYTVRLQPAYPPPPPPPGRMGANFDEIPIYFNLLSLNKNFFLNKYCSKIGPVRPGKKNTPPAVPFKEFYWI